MPLPIVNTFAGDPLDRIRQGNTERNIAGVPESREWR
jgi:hypothetical protein